MSLGRLRLEVGWGSWPYDPVVWHGTQAIGRVYVVGRLLVAWVVEP